MYGQGFVSFRVSTVHGEIQTADLRHAQLVQLTTMLQLAPFAINLTNLVVDNRTTLLVISTKLSKCYI
jgi:hypothetical protein